MGSRITKVYTRTGDDGTTGMADGSRVAKSSPLVAAIGDIDELNAVIGLLRSENLEADIDRGLLQVQQELFAFGGELSMPAFQQLSETGVERIERGIDRFNATLPPLKEFILPAGNRAVALCHLARVVCRRAERALSGLDPRPRAVLLSYINRLSDYLFVLARAVASQQGIEEVYWQSSRAGDDPSL
jgi:cob(I)alamin adenosyltransferase